MVTRFALTTVDNPFDPFDEFVQWLEWDRASGYDTPSYLGRIVVTSEELPDALEADAVEEAIDSILLEHGDTFYKKLSREDQSETKAAS